MSTNGNAGRGLRHFAVIGALVVGCNGGSGSFEATIGPEGGELRAGEFLLEIPPGALAEPTRLSVVESASEDAAATSSEYRLSPDGLEFAIPARIHLPSTDPEGSILLVSPDAVSQWSGLPTEPEPGRVTARIPHLSRYVARRRGSWAPCLFDAAAGAWDCPVRAADGLIAIGIGEWGDIDTQPNTHGRGWIDLVRIHGEGGRLRYLAHVTPTRPLRLAPAAVLTHAQREIAELVAAGATLPEVAQMTQRSRETVRSHLKAIYARLGVASRAELACALEPAE